MIEAITALISTLLTVENGIFGLGWIIALFLLYKNYTNKEKRDTVIDETRAAFDEELKERRTKHDEDMKLARDQFDARVKEVIDSSAESVRLLQDRISKLHDDYIAMLTQQSDKRIEDLKDLTEEYNKMSEIMIQTLEKLTQSISKKRGQ